MLSVGWGKLLQSAVVSMFSKEATCTIRNLATAQSGYLSSPISQMSYLILLV